MKSVDAGPAGDVERLYRDDGARLWRAILFLSGDPEIANDAVAEAFAQALARGSEGATAQTLARLPGTALRLVGTRDAVYVLDSDNVLDPTRRIVRFDIGSGRLTTSGPLWGALDLAVTDGSVWVSGGSRGSAGNGIIYRLDRITLGRQESITLPAPAGHLAVGPAGVWAGAGKAAYLIDPAAGGVVRSVDLPEVAGALAIGPSNELYVETHPVGDLSPGPIEELDATTGQLLASGPGPGGVSWVSLSAARGGVWTTFATGMLGAAERLSARDLRPSAALKTENGRRFHGSNGIQVSVAGRVLWVFDQGAQYGCFDPVTGTRRATLGFRFSAVTDVNSTVYAIGQPVLDRPVFDLIRITPGPGCLG
jgi:hypothetical protein